MQLACSADWWRLWWSDTSLSTHYYITLHYYNFYYSTWLLHTTSSNHPSHTAWHQVTLPSARTYLDECLLNCLSGFWCDLSAGRGQPDEVALWAAINLELGALAALQWQSQDMLTLWLAHWGRQSNLGQRLYSVSRWMAHKDSTTLQSFDAQQQHSTANLWCTAAAQHSTAAHTYNTDCQHNRSWTSEHSTLYCHTIHCTLSISILTKNTSIFRQPPK